MNIEENSIPGSSTSPAAVLLISPAPLLLHFGLVPWVVPSSNPNLLLFQEPPLSRSFPGPAPPHSDHSSSQKCVNVLGNSNGSKIMWHDCYYTLFFSIMPEFALNHHTLSLLSCFTPIQLVSSHRISFISPSGHRLGLLLLRYPSCS